MNTGFCIKHGVVDDLGNGNCPYCFNHLMDEKKIMDEKRIDEIKNAHYNCLLAMSEGQECTCGDHRTESAALRHGGEKK